jgi:hypothetical protein
MDEDTFSDDLVFEDNSFQLGPGLLKIGPNTFDISALVPHSKVQHSEPSYESAAELYFRIAAEGAGVKTKWANSQVENVPFK